jgi:hypothetical protein
MVMRNMPPAERSISTKSKPKPVTLVVVASCQDMNPDQPFK